MIKIDARGLSCPEPVLRAMEQIEKGESEIEVSVDTNISMENVKRNFEKNGYSVTTKEEEDFSIVTGKK